APSPPEVSPLSLHDALAISGGTSGLAIASMVLGIVWVFWVGSLLAVIFGHVALSQIKRSVGTLGGRGMAIAGLVLGYLGLATLRSEEHTSELQSLAYLVCRL